ncbi:hypothetical protein EGX98_03240 [Fusobacterium necrophorum]|uniref:Outer membrane protein beta-barrel domain-containing protein n=2 Tax=Fusobacterium necrophorum TaxID=859 RepID=A0AB73BY74_9FUSO|nr:hypothetical protein [Fusobacterium necrophorum]AYZ73147.1 hypothetical protein EGX98_03240 [Fusobacterium necrophorum]AZW08855.1 hypothetical protein EO219_04170 [Fusobacterium necrophorum subsp. necrophorum]KDE64875.1 hypothetical protein FUSO3_02005 [Fusobacterium necrophorum BL]KDE67040.1 hypothetical protein FUSO4_03610 [Fusobacterium necrophorum DJ-1]KDE71389.1 hypothetical protein FUSO8_08005 [Fusobacterium necrophorum DJ-2]
MNKKLHYFVAFFLLSTFSYSFSFEAPKTYEIQVLSSAGKMDGFVQIPKGGQYGTTSKERPTFEELGVNYVYYPEITFTTKWDKFSMSLHGKYETFKGKAHVKEDLISHNVFIPKDSSLRTKHKYAYYGWNLHYDVITTEKWKLTPAFGINVFDFSYEFSAVNKEGDAIANKDTRKFHAGIPTIGFKTNYQLMEKTKIIFSFMSNIPMKSVKQYLDMSLLVSYNLYQNNERELNLIGGIGYEKWKFRDSQKEMQNYMKHSIAPIYKVGLEYKF